MKRWWLLFLLLLVMISPVRGQVHAQDDPEAARITVQQWLLRELGKPNLVLVEYTYTSGSWEDSALGCPIPGHVYTPGLLNGYEWSFLFDNMVRYYVHSDFTGTQAVLCRAVSITPDIRMTQYTNANFAILTPESWLIYPSEAEVWFGSQQAPTCDQPGMRVSLLGRVAAGTTPDQLLDEYTTINQITTTARETVGTGGSSMLYQSDCEGTLRQWRVSAFVEYGSGYRIEQWVPQSEFDRWSQLFLDMLTRFTPGQPTPINVTAPTTDTPAASADNPAPAPLPPLPVAHLFVGDVFTGRLDNMPGRSVTAIPTLVRRYLTFSPDGLYLAFMDTTGTQIRSLNLNESRNSRPVTEDVDPTFPLSWSLDSREIAFAVATEATDPNGAPIYEIRAAPFGGGEARVLGSFPFAGTCPPVYTDAADEPYYVETGPNGQDNLLVWLPNDQFLISTHCLSGIGILNLADGQILDLGADLHGGAVSPDRARLLTHTANGLVLLDLTTGERVELAETADALQVAWGANGQTIYYSTAAPTTSITLDQPSDQERGQTVFGFWPVTTTTYTVSLVRLDLTTGEKALLWQGQGRGIGRIAPAPDSSGVLFSLVTSGERLVQAFQTGAGSQALREVQPSPVLYWLPAGGSTARLLAYAGQPVFAPITVTVTTEPPQ